MDSECSLSSPSSFPSSSYNSYSLDDLPSDRLCMDAMPTEEVPLRYTVHDERFAPVVQVFRSNVQCGLERAGAAFAVFHKGEPAVHVWGGWKRNDEGNKQPWEEDTMSVLFSTTKCLSALTLAWVLQENCVSYNDRVTTVWPEYGRNGKEKTTIQDIALHRAGLPYGNHPLTRDEVQSHQTLSAYFEDAVPLWKPGTQSGYHALTIGLLMDQVVRRIDKRRRAIWDILDEDILRPHGIVDLSIGLRNASDDIRVATLSGPDERDLAEEERRCAESLRRYNLGGNAYNDRLKDVFPWILPTSHDYNRVENRVLPMPSNMGIGSARSFAHLLSLVATKNILNNETLRLLSSPVLEDEMDVINGYPESKGFGFQYTRSPKGDWQWGHSGLGGQNVRVDVSSQLSLVYICNGMKVADAEMVEPWNRLVRAVYDCL